MTYEQALLKQKADTLAEIDRRGERLQNLFSGDEKSSLRNQQYERDACKEDIYHWFNYVFIYEPRPLPQQIPFLPWGFQRKLIDELLAAIRGGYDLRLEKSRDMGATWTILLVFTYLWQFHGMTFLVGSRKAEEVDKLGDLDTLLPKIRYVLQREPPWLLPKGFNLEEHASYMNIRNPETGASITGESNNANFGTGGRKNAIFFDEFAKWEYTDSLAWTSAFQNTPCRIAASTPLYKGNKFFTLKGEPIKNLRLHWTEHPLHGIVETVKGKKVYPWYEDQKQRASAQEIAQELDISYLGVQRSAVFFDEINLMRTEKRLKEVLYEPGLEVIWANDPGDICWSHGFYQILGYAEEIRWIDYYEDSNKDLDFYVDWVKSAERVWNKVDPTKPGGRDNYIRGWEGMLVLPDPHEISVSSMKSGKSLKKQWTDLGFRVWLPDYPLGKKEALSESRRVFRNLWMDDGRNNARMKLALDRMNSYHYKLNESTGEADEDPVHDINSHCADQFKTFAGWIKRPEKYARQLEKEKDRRDRSLTPVHSYKDVGMAGA